MYILFMEIKDMEIKKLTLNVPVHLHKELKLMALMEETTMTEIILKEVERVVKEYKKTHK